MGFKVDKPIKNVPLKSPKEVDKLTKDLLYGKSEEKLLKKVKEGKIKY